MAAHATTSITVPENFSHTTDKVRVNREERSEKERERERKKKNGYDFNACNNVREFI